VPTILLFFPFNDPKSLQVVIAAWQPAPALVSCFTYVFAKIANMVKRSSEHSQKSQGDDIFHLRAIYQTTGTIAACIHLSVVIGCVISRETSLMQIFIPKDSFAQVETLADGVFVFFQNDFLLVTAASFIWSLVNIADLHRSGLSNVHWKVGLGYLLAGFVFIGPGASAAALWFWREEVMSRRKANK
jgi:hypothetical protein